MAICEMCCGSGGNGFRRGRMSGNGWKGRGWSQRGCTATWVLSRTSLQGAVHLVIWTLVDGV